MLVWYRTKKYYRDRNYAEARLSGVEPTTADERAIMDKNARALMISYVICGNVIKVCTNVVLLMILWGSKDVLVT